MFKYPFLFLITQEIYISDPLWSSSEVVPMRSGQWGVAEMRIVGLAIHTCPDTPQLSLHCTCNTGSHMFQMKGYKEEEGYLIHIVFSINMI